MDQNYNINARTENFTENTRLNDKKYGGWMCTNEGTSDCKVLGFTIAPGEGLDFRKEVPPGSCWTAPIDIEVTPGGIIRMVRLQNEPNGGEDNPMRELVQLLKRFFGV